MASDLQVIAPKLVRSGLWSGRDNLCRYKHVILDADSIAAHLYRLCVADQVRRQRCIISTNQIPDLYSASLVNYSDYCGRIEQLFMFISDHNIEPIVVYSGKTHLEPNFYGLIAGEQASNTQKVNYRLSSLINYDHKQSSSSDIQLDLPPLAMNLFKLTFNTSKILSPAKCMAYQAYYSSFPLMAKLARDFKCPVLTNEFDFLLMDVRAGFILFDDFWLHHVELHHLATTAVISKEQNSVIKMETRKLVSPKSSTGGGSCSPMTIGCTFHYNKLFLRQHPGLTPETALYLFPLTNVDFVTCYAAQLKKVRIYDLHYNRQQDYLFRPLASGSDPPRKNKLAYGKYHKAAKRLELALNYLCGQESIVLENFIKGDPSIRSRVTGFGADFRFMVSKYAVAHDFRQRLKFILKKSPFASQKDSDKQLDHVQECLTRRECTSGYLIDVLLCSLGRTSTKSFNISLAYEDLKTSRSAQSVGDRSRSMLMNLFSPLPPPSKQNNRPQWSTGKPARLLRVDRALSKMAEIVVDNLSDCEGSKLEELREPLKLAKLSSNSKAATDPGNKMSAAAKFINQAFMTTDLRQLPKKLDDALTSGVALAKDLRVELAIVWWVFKFCLQNACRAGDNYFKRAYSKVGRDFELALVNHYIHLNCRLPKSSKSKPSEQQQQQNPSSALVALISRRDLENVALASEGAQSSRSSKSLAAASSPTINSKSSTGSSAQILSKLTAKSSKSSVASSGGSSSTKLTQTITSPEAAKSSRKIRHLIEMLNVGLATYFELNGFLGYPLPRLSNFPLHYNPILLYNLTLLSGDKALFNQF